jgi:hypothetical protein
MTDNQNVQKTETTEIQPGNKKFSITALISLISGILTYALIILHSLINMKFLLAAILAPITAVIAISTGFHARRQIRKSEGLYTGKKMANTGLWLGWIYIAICVLLLLLVVLIGGAIAAAVSKMLH